MSCCWELRYLPTNQPTNQSTNLPTNQPTNQPTNEPTKCTGIQALVSAVLSVYSWVHAKCRPDGREDDIGTKGVFSECSSAQQLIGCLLGVSAA